MISFQSLNILIASLIALIIGSILFRYFKKNQVLLNAKRTALLFFLIAGFFFLFYGLSKVFLLTPYKQWALRSEIDHIPVMKAIEQYHPIQYNLLIQKANESVKTNQIPDDVVAYSYIYANQIFINDLKFAPDEAIYDYIVKAKEFYEALYQVDPKLVVQMEHADVSMKNQMYSLRENANFRPIFDNTVIAKRNVIAQAATNPKEPPTKEAVDSLFNNVMKKLSDKYGLKAVKSTFHLSQGNIPPEIEAQIIIDFYNEIIHLDKAQVGMLMRYIASLSAKSA